MAGSGFSIDEFNKMIEQAGGLGRYQPPQSGTLVPEVINVNTNQNVPTGGFEALLNQLRTGVNANRGLLGKAARYGPGAGRTVSELGEGDYLGAAGSVGGMLAAGAGMKALAGAIPAVGLPGMLAKGALYAGGSVLGSNVGASLAGGLGKALGMGGQAVQDTAGAAERRQMAQGQSPGVIPGTGGVGIEGLSIAQLKELAMTQPEVMERLLPTINRERDAQMSRQMQLNQQLGQLTGALNQQKYMAELAGGAQSEAGATTRTMLTAPNPYAASSFQYRG
jgi:hypothetical protein